MRRSSSQVTAALAGAMMALLPVASAAVGPGGSVSEQPPGSVRVVSTGPSGAPGRAASEHGRVSSSGRWVALSSAARLDRRDHGRDRDVYLVDRRAGEVRLLSRSPRGVEGDGASRDADISGTGRWVVFTSLARNLVRGGGPAGVYRADRVTGRTVLVAAGARSASISDDGASVALIGAGGAAYLVDVASGAARLVSHAVADPTAAVPVAKHPRISGDGRFVVYATTSDAAVAGDTNGAGDVVRWDRASGEGVLVSTTPDGASGDGVSDQPDVSRNGRTVVFRSLAQDLGPAVGRSYGHVYVRHLGTGTEGTTELVDLDVDDEPPANRRTLASREPAISPDGGSVAFTSNGWRLVEDARVDSRWSQTYVRHLDQGERGRTELASHDRRGDGAETTSWDPAVSRGGATVLFTTNAPSLVGRGLDRYPTQVLAFRSR